MSVLPYTVAGPNSIPAETMSAPNHSRFLIRSGPLFLSIFSNKKSSARLPVLINYLFN